MNVQSLFAFAHDATQPNFLRQNMLHIMQHQLCCYCRMYGVESLVYIKHTLDAVLQYHSQVT